MSRRSVSLISVSVRRKKRVVHDMEKRAGISGSTLKIIAVVSMLTDHTAAVLFGWSELAFLIMRQIIGRLAFPIYCFLLVEGFEKTSSRRKYAGRLFLFALISEIPFDLAFHRELFYSNYQNVFFTLFLGFLMIWLMDVVEKHCRSFVLRMLGQAAVFLAAAALMELLYCDYGAHGAIAIALLYLFRKRKLEQIIAGCVAFLWEITAPVAFIFVAFYNGRRGMKLKYFFYIFYPAHLLILYLVSLVF